MTALSAQFLLEEAQLLELLNEVGTAVAAELDLDRTVQVVTDAATRLSGAAFGSFFYNVVNDKGEAYTLYTLSGAQRESFAQFPMPRNTAVFGPTFRGEGIVRSDDITKDPRYGQNHPYHGMPQGHLPVRSYLAAPVKSRSGEVLGGLFFGHSNVGVFNERAERIIAAIAVQAGIAIDKARLYRAAQDEIGRRQRVEAELRASEARYRNAVITGRIGAWETDMVKRTRIWTEEGMALFGLNLPGGLGHVGGDDDEFWRSLHPDDKHMMAQFHRTADQVDSYPCEYRIVKPDGTMMWVSGRGRVVARGPDGKCQRVANIVVDVTERKKAEERVQLLMREVSHRSKNMLSVVQAIAGQTARTAGSLAEFETRFGERLHSLAASHDILVQENWRGVPLANLVHEQLAFFAEPGTARLAVEGPAVMLTTAVTQTIGLALHELATNAIKYGAWSVPSGKVTISWRFEQGLANSQNLRVDWSESCGPSIVAPAHKGFGRLVIEEMVSQSTKGIVQTDYLPTGLHWTLLLPIQHIVGPS
jgi:two-component sensor histidine kinase/PAS domain-containing protein